MIDPAAYRRTLGRFATGVAFVTAIADGEPAGLIVNSLASVSLRPPLLSFCPSRHSRTWERMRPAGRFGVNVLGEQHAAFVRRAAPAGADRFAAIDHRPGPGGAPMLTDAVAYVGCVIDAEHAAGDHWIVVARVEEVRARAGVAPLVVWDGRLGGLAMAPRTPAAAPPWPSPTPGRRRPRRPRPPRPSRRAA